jgi:acetyl-CoA carboxylase carboxyl transferase subunit alpha
MNFEKPIRVLEEKLVEMKQLQEDTKFDITSEIEALEKELEGCISTTYAGLGPWERVSVARHPERPVATDYVTHLLDEFHELHGDKVFGDDRAIMTGLARLGEQRFLLVAHRKGRTTKERLACNFGSAHPEGYRKALRKMRLAEKLGLPIVTMINTPGAYPGIGAEERGQAAAIAENIMEMFELETPIMAMVIGEGGSGGALGIGIGDSVLMMEYAYYSVISPEGCAAILWKDGARTPEAAAALRLTASDLSEMGLIDGVIREPLGGAHRDHVATYGRVGQAILAGLKELDRVPREVLCTRRLEKFRRLGALQGRFPVL